MKNRIDQLLCEFFNQIETDYSIPKGQIWKKWSAADENNVSIENNVGTTTTVATTATKKPVKDGKKSRYQVFFSIQRALLMKNDPSMTFGDISRKVSEMWKLIPPAEKLQYTDDTMTTTTTQNVVPVVQVVVKTATPAATTTTTPTTTITAGSPVAKQSSSPIKSNYDKRKDDLEKMSMKLLRVLYNEKNIPGKHNNKNGLITALLENEFPSGDAVVVRNKVILPTSATISSDKSQNNNDGSRSNLEFSLDEDEKDANDDEEDFYFQTDDLDDEISNNNEEVDNDDDDMIDDMNDEIFGDDD